MICAHAKFLSWMHDDGAVVLYRVFMKYNRNSALTFTCMHTINIVVLPIFGNYCLNLFIFFQQFFLCDCNLMQINLFGKYLHGNTWLIFFSSVHNCPKAILSTWIKNQSLFNKWTKKNAKCQVSNTITIKLRIVCFFAT